MKLRLISLVVLAALLAIFAATSAPQETAGNEAPDGYSWFDGR